MTKIVHLSDIHMAPAGERVVGFDPAARLAAVVEAVNAEHADAALCIVSGDLADRGDEVSYRRLAPLLAGLVPPVRLMLGNHDRREPFRRVFPEAPDDGAGFVQEATDLGALRLVLLDTLDEAAPSAGRLGSARLAWLEKALAARPDAATLVFLHHPPFPLGIDYFNAMLLEDGDRLEALLDRHPQVIHTAFGHVHFATCGRSGRRSFSATRGTCHPLHPLPAGLSARYVDRPPACDVILVDGGRVVVHPLEVAPVDAVVARETADGDGGPGSITVFRPATS